MVELMQGVEALQLCMPGAALPARRSIDFCGRLAASNGARVLVSLNFPDESHGFLRFDKELSYPIEAVADAIAWASAARGRFLLVAGSAKSIGLLHASGIPCVEVTMAEWHSESTLFAESGLSHLLGDPYREPLAPSGPYSSGPIGYAAFSAMCAINHKLVTMGYADSSVVDGFGALSWINWKAAAGTSMGREMIRAGSDSDWPMLECQDGYVCLIYTEKEWPAVCEMIGDPEIRQDKFADYDSRLKFRSEWIPIARSWAKGKTKKEISGLFSKYQIPATAVQSPADLLDDELLKYRQAFSKRTDCRGDSVASIRLPHRIEEISPATFKDADANTGFPDTLPLSGIRVLDLGIITAGAGTTGILADLGAEVIKVESETHPDPFRKWAGSTDSPLFRFNNRNKYGVSLDLKSAYGKARFLELEAEADLVVENFRRGVLERLGLGFDALARANQSIVLASISGQGASGPGTSDPTYGSTLEASSGFSYLSRYEDGVPHVTGYNVNYPDQTVCLYGAAAIVMALTAASQRGSGLHIDVSQRDTAAYIIGELIERASCPSSMWRLPDDYVFEECLQSSEGDWISIAVPSWEHLVQASETLSDSESLASWVGQSSTDAVVTTLRAFGCAAAEVLNGEGMLSLNNASTTQTFKKSEAGELVKGFPFTLTNSPMSIFKDAPSVGLDNPRYLKAS